MENYPENELRVDLLASGGINPWHQHNSSSRQQMMGGHLSQSLVVEGCTIRRCLTGIEREFGRFTFNVKMPVNAEIIKVISKYPKMIGYKAIKDNPLSVVVYEDVDTKEVGILQVPKFHCIHQHFGFQYDFRPSINKLTVGSAIAKGTILADSPAVDNLGNYKLGLESEVAFMSLPGVIEDGVIISEAYAQRLKTKGFESRVASWGNKYYPINLYGTENEYKPFPDIGDRIRDDGLLFALRSYDDLLGPIEMTPAATTEPDYTFDKLVYAEPGALVVDISVLHDRKIVPGPTPEAMETQASRYYMAQMAFYKNLLEVHADLKRMRKEALRITPEFHRLLVEAQIFCQEPGKNRAKQIYQRQPLDDWRVEVTFQYDIVPTEGFKITDLAGEGFKITELH